MAKKWIRCDAFLQDNEGILPLYCVTAILNGKIDIFTEAGRKLINTNAATVKGPSTKQEIENDAAEYSKSIGCNVRTQVGPTPSRVFEPKNQAKTDSINARIECMRGLYYYTYPETSVLDNFILFRRLLDCPKNLQLKELSKFMFKYEDAVRCFGLHSAEDAPTPVAVVHDHPAGQEGPTPPTDSINGAEVDSSGNTHVAENQDKPVVKSLVASQIQDPITSDLLKEKCRRMRAEGKKYVDIAVALWPEDCAVWVTEKERLDRNTLKKERNRLEQKVCRLLSKPV